MTFCVPEVVVIVLFRVEVVCVVVLSPVVNALSAAIQVKFEAGFAVNRIFTVPPLQIVAALTLVIVGFGFTVMFMALLVNGFPLIQGELEVSLTVTTSPLCNVSVV